MMNGCSSVQECAQNTSKSSAAMVGVKKAKPRGNNLPLELKLDILRRKAQGECASVISQNLGLSQSTVSSVLRRMTIKKAKHEAIKKDAENTIRNAVIKHNSLIVEMERILKIWIVDQSHQNINLSFNLVSQKAFNIFERLKVEMGAKHLEFNPDRQWFERFRQHLTPDNNKVASSYQKVGDKFKPALEKCTEDRGIYNCMQPVINYDGTVFCWNGMTYIEEGKSVKCLPGYQSSNSETEHLPLNNIIVSKTNDSRNATGTVLPVENIMVPKVNESRITGTGPTIVFPVGAAGIVLPVENIMVPKVIESRNTGTTVFPVENITDFERNEKRNTIIESKSGSTESSLILGLKQEIKEELQDHIDVDAYGNEFIAVPETTQQTSQALSKEEGSELNNHTPNSLVTSWLITNTDAQQQCSNSKAQKHCLNTDALQQCSNTDRLQQCSNTDSLQQCLNTDSLQQCSNTDSLQQCSNTDSLQQCSSFIVTDTFVKEEEVIKEEIDWDSVNADENNSDGETCVSDLQAREPSDYLHNKDCPTEIKNGPKNEEEWAERVMGDSASRPEELFKCIDCGFMVECRKCLRLHMEDHVLEKYEVNPLGGYSYNSFHYKWFDTDVEKFFVVE